MSIIAGTAIESALGGYEIDRSLRFNSADSAYLNRTPASAGNRTTWTFSCWAKKCKNGTGMFLLSADASNASYIYWTSADIIKIRNTTVEYESTPVYRDPSSWYHLVWVWDTNNATAGNRTRLWVNGVEVNNWTVETHPSSGEQSYINSNVIHNIGRYTITSGFYFDGYLTEINFIDGQALTPSSFGETNPDTGVWQPIEYAGTYGTNGFYINFSDNSGTTSTTLGKDYSGNGNNWTPNNFSVTAGAGNDSLVDVPTLWGTDTAAGGTVRGNYSTLNPLAFPAGFSITVSNGNLDVVFANSTYAKSIGSTLGLSSGKWYFEGTANSGASVSFIGIEPSNSTIFNDTVSASRVIGYSATGYSYFSNGDKRNNNTDSSYGNSYTTNDVIGVALDLDSGKIWFAKNNTWQASGDPAAGTNAAFSSIPAGTYIPGVSAYNSQGWTLNFGQRPFSYTAPSGFKALVTTNLPEPTVLDGSDYMNAFLWTGTQTAQSISTGFQPGLVWNKSRSNADYHNVFDIVRGGIARLVPNTSDQESSTGNGFAGITSTGFDLDGSGGGGDNNASGRTYVGWVWKANGSGVTNNIGTIQSTVSANTTSGVSVVTYSGTGSVGTIGHGIGIAPSMVIVKRRNGGSGYSWHVQHISTGNTRALFLDSTSSGGTSNVYWNSTSPTITVFTAGTDTSINGSGGTFVAYCFAPVSAFSAFGSFVGNGSSDGPFVFTNFRPRYVLLKRTNTTGSWYVWDTTRDTYNWAYKWLAPNDFAAENTSSGANVWDIDILSNGFKIRNDGAFDNGSGSTYIYAAFAENPFKYALAR
jgi:hypothetical protein